MRWGRKARRGVVGVKSLLDIGHSVAHNKVVANSVSRFDYTTKHIWKVIHDFRLSSIRGTKESSGAPCYDFNSPQRMRVSQVTECMINS